jgi:hypothetical protein
MKRKVAKAVKQQQIKQWSRRLAKIVEADVGLIERSRSILGELRARISAAERQNIDQRNSVPGREPVASLELCAEFRWMQSTMQLAGAIESTLDSVFELVEALDMQLINRVIVLDDTEGRE